MEVALDKGLFWNDKFTIEYGTNKEATFTIVDEEFAGLNTLARVNQIVITVKDLTTREAQLCTAVIGMGDGVVGVKTDEDSLRGKLLNKDNMGFCVVELYE
jgi:hypothetical protein